MIEARPALDPELAALVAAQQHELGSTAFTPDDDARYLIAVVDGRAVACAAWRPAPGHGVAELQRVYVRPAFRGRGIARQLIVWIEEEALAAGRSVIRLETGPCSPAAVALFQSSGYDQAGGAFVKRLAALVQ
ncbi:GNAT family N-acetyltransferase [Actinoplanes sp. NPDC049596]|uniref:GNAT family N-acetyltransferase n=1 Tax=unclassified Actinoplanes TaxID=2626549 RepID=UPI00343013C0